MADEINLETQNDTAATPEAAPAAKKTAAKRTTAKKAAAKKAPAKRTTKKAAAAPPAPSEDVAPPADPVAEAATEAPAKKTAARKTAAKKAPAKKVAAKKTTAKKATATTAAPEPTEAAETVETTAAPVAAEAPEAAEAPAKKATAKKAAAKKAPAKKATAKRTTKKATAAPAEATAETAAETAADEAVAPAAPGVLFQAPEKTPRKRAARKKVAEQPVEQPAEDATEAAVEAEPAEQDESTEHEAEEQGEGTPARRRRRRGGRRRRKSGEGNGEGAEDTDEDAEDGHGEHGENGEEQHAESTSSRRRRRRRRAGESGGENSDDPENTVTRVREARPLEQQITAVSGSTRLEAKKQRRREGREAGRRRAPIVSEAEFLARRESVERVMVIRQREELTQIGVLEDKVLVEHYVARESQTSLIGNIYLGRVQNVLPSMEAAFVDIGKGRNAVLYAGEVNWSSLGWREGQPRKIESVLSSGQTVLVQVTKDPIGHKGARLTSQISLAGRFLVYVPDGTTSGISRKLPDTERNRLKTLLKEIVPDTAGVIVRTAAEGASEEELTRDVERLKARWEDIEAKAKGSAPQLLYGEPDLTLKVVRDLFTEDFSKLVIQGNDAWDTVQGYVAHVAPDLEERLERFVPGEDGRDVFATYRIDEQIAKGLDRKVWLPSGGSLIIDRTEAMTVVDVNTGKFTGSGGNLEETVTKNNLEAAEEIVRQLRLRDIGGIIVVDFIDMVLESNRDLVLRRLVECLGRDRTRHQVAEVTSLGLVQMTRKRIGTGLVEAFSETCPHCHGRGILVQDHPVEEGKSSGVAPDEPRRGRRRGGRGKSAAVVEETAAREPAAAKQPTEDETPRTPTPAEFAAMARHHDEDAPGEDAAEALDAVEIEASDAVEAPEPAGAAVVDEFSEEKLTPEPASEPEPEPEAPTVKVVTRTRGRRGASRPAGATAEVAAPVAAIVVEAPAVPDGEAASTPEPPKVITRARRGASRSVTTPADHSADHEADHQH
jgi:ribonuclease E